MKKIGDVELQDFVKNCKVFYRNKEEEIIRLFSVKVENKDLKIIKEINIPKKAMVGKTEFVSLDKRYFWYVCQELKKQREGVLVVHNHKYDSNPSPMDLNVYFIMQKIIEIIDLDVFVFFIYSDCNVYYSIDLKEKRIVKRKVKIF